MDGRRLFDELVGVAARLGAEVRLEPFSIAAANGGGLCTLGGHALILIDEHAPPSTRVEVLARALGRLEVDAVYMTPEARDAVGRHAGEPRRTPVGGHQES
jgi:hypothetical protein